MLVLAIWGAGMREGITVEVSAADRARLAAIIADRNSPQKHVWRARIVLLTADGLGTNEIMRQAGTSKVTVWRWQERFMRSGVAGLLRDKTRPSRIPPLPASVHARVIALTRRSAGRGDPLDGGDDGPGGRHQRQLGAADLARPRTRSRTGCASSSCRNDPEVRRQAARHRRPLPRSAGARDRALASTRSRRSRRSTAPSRGCR